MKNKDSFRFLVLSFQNLLTQDSKLAGNAMLSDYSLNFTTGAFSYALKLSPGWNFISLPVEPLDAAVSTVLEDILSNVIVVWGYDNQNKLWRKYMPDQDPSLNTLHSLEAGKGYWIKMKEADNLTIYGNPAPASVYLHEGWNMVGYAGTDGADADDELSYICDKWLTVWGFYKGAWKLKSESLNLPFQPLGSFNKGKAYWIKIKAGVGSVDWTQ